MQLKNKVCFWWDGDVGCYDVEVSDEDATVADYERAAEEELLAAGAVRKYGGSCIGCSICCGGRLPLTAVDLYRLKMGGLGMALPLDQWMAAYGSVQKRGGCTDAVLRLDDLETCALWDRQSGTCRVYSSRPLICRTYICAPHSWRASEIRARIVNAGEDELVSMLGIWDEGGESPMPQPFAGVLDYGGVRLKELCPAGLWRRLTGKSGQRQGKRC